MLHAVNDFNYYIEPLLEIDGPWTMYSERGQLGCTCQMVMIAAKRGFTPAAIIAQQRAFMNFVKNISINLQVKPSVHS